ncbi:MAG: hypothetical protein ACYCPR_11080 [Thermoplasmataceae archaeon]
MHITINFISSSNVFNGQAGENNNIEKGLHGPKLLDKIKIHNTPVEESLDNLMDYDRIFSIVKKSVKTVLGKERSGLGLALSDLPVTLGAFWQVGGNYIVMNEVLVKAMSRIAKTPREFNSFVYTILTHEYLHSVGYIDEFQARQMTALVAKQTFGSEHPAVIMSSGDIWKQYPLFLSLRGGDGSVLKIISRFDTDSTSYIA